MTKVITKKANFKELLPDFKRFALKKLKLRGASEARKVLACVGYDGKYLHATDSHRLIRIKADYVELPKDAPFLYNVRTDKYEKGSYPNVERLFPSEYQTVITVTSDKLTELKRIVDAVNKEAAEYDNRTTYFEYKDGSISLQAREYENDDKNEVRTVSGIYADGEAEVNLTVNSLYLKEALLTANKLLRYSGASEIYLKFNGALRPIVITDGIMYDMLVMPARRV